MQSCPLSAGDRPLLETDDLGAVVDADDLHAVPTNRLSALWDGGFARVERVLRAHADPGFTESLDRVAAWLTSLIDRDPDFAIFQVVRQEIAGVGRYGAAHSLHAAIAVTLAAQRLGWAAGDVHTAFKAALTMNLSMLELQGQLALQPSPLTPTQREAIRLHPMRSAEVLRAAGVADEDWLAAVAQHHEAPGGSGYPNKLHEPTEMAGLLRRADVYTAKLSPRATRKPLPAHEAARSMFLQDRGHPMAAALVKAFGVYPPGCCVRLATGEVALVVKRGGNTNTPIVATLTDKHGDPIPESLLRGTDRAGHAVVRVIDEKLLTICISRERLAALGRG